jgi:hypothetical protein
MLVEYAAMHIPAIRNLTKCSVQPKPILTLMPNYFLDKLSTSVLTFRAFCSSMRLVSYKNKNDIKTLQLTVSLMCADMLNMKVRDKRHRPHQEMRPQQTPQVRLLGKMRKLHSNVHFS